MLPTLYDVLTRQQIYVEGVKQYHAIQFSNVIVALRKELKLLFADLQYDTLDALTKAQFNRFVLEVRKTQKRVYSAYTDQLIADLEAFAGAHSKLTQQIYTYHIVATVDADGVEDTPDDPNLTDESAVEVLFGKTKDDSDRPAPLFGWASLGLSAAAAAVLWARLSASPMPANGVLPLVFLNNFVAGASKSIENEITKGYVNSAKTADVLREIVGTPSNNFRDGRLNAVQNGFNAASGTIIQHVASATNTNVASVFFDRYQWVSVIDSGTTDICRGRNGNVYTAGQGPLPPAHIGCRSHTVPLEEGATSVANQSYFNWMQAQPDEVQDDILGKSQADKLRAGKIKAGEMARFSDAKPLSVDEYLAKLRIILKG